MSAVRRWGLTCNSLHAEGGGYPPSVAKPSKADTPYEVACPHCKKRFEAPLLSGDSERYQGFKCPHCRLFVSLSRAEEQDQAQPRS